MERSKANPVLLRGSFSKASNAALVGLRPGGGPKAAALEPLAPIGGLWGFFPWAPWTLEGVARESQGCAGTSDTLAHRVMELLFWYLKHGEFLTAGSTRFHQAS